MEAYFSTVFLFKHSNFLFHTNRDATWIHANVKFVRLMFMEHHKRNTWEFKKKTIRNRKQNEMLIPEGFFRKKIEKKF